MPQRFNVTIAYVAPANKISLIKYIRDLLPIGLREAKECSEGAKEPLLQNLSAEDAELFRSKLSAAGATVEVRPCT